MAVAPRENTEGGGGSQHPICTVSRPVSESPRVGFWGRNPPAQPPAGRRRGRREGGSQRNRPKGPGEAAGREKPGREAPGAAPASRQVWSLASPVPKGRAGCTYPTRVVPAAGAGVPGVPGVPRVPRISHGADCAAAAPRAARHRLPAPDRTTRRGDAPWGRRAHGTRRRLGPPPRRPPRTLSVRRSGRASSGVG